MSVPASTEESKAARLLRNAGALATGGALLALGVPVLLIELARAGQFGLAASSHVLTAESGGLVAVGGVLVMLALFLYRRSFGHLKHVDPRLRPVSALCLVGSLGAIAAVAAGAYLAGRSSAVSACVGGRASHALACLRAADPTAGYLALVSFALLWIGAVALAAGLILCGRHFRALRLTAGGGLYAVFAAEILLPFLGSLVVVPGFVYALALAPWLAVAAGALVMLGASATAASS